MSIPTNQQFSERTSEAAKLPESPVPFTLKETGAQELAFLCVAQPHHTIYLMKVVFLGKFKEKNEEHFEFFNPLAPIDPEEGPDEDLFGWKDEDGNIIDVLGVSSVRFVQGKIILNGINFENPDWSKLSVQDANRIYEAAYNAVKYSQQPI